MRRRRRPTSPDAVNANTARTQATGWEVAPTSGVTRQSRGDAGANAGRWARLGATASPTGRRSGSPDAVVAASVNIDAANDTATTNATRSLAPMTR